MRGDQSVGVIIPALNEEQAIGKVISCIPDWVDRIVVVDNGSTDRTSAVARSAGSLVVSESSQGYGGACQAGLRHASDLDVIVFLDGDYSDYPEDMSALVGPIVAKECDMVIGSRVLNGLPAGALAPQQRFGNWLACTLLRLIWGVRFTDLGPFRAITRKSLEKMEVQDRTYGWNIEMQIKAVINHLAIREVPVRYRPRIGKSKISGTLTGTVKAGWKILTTIARFAWQSKTVGIWSHKQRNHQRV
jgi:glycosyltransferase involved in cell wall biosynthesis